MLNDETLKALIEAIIYVAPEPVSLEAILKTLEGEERGRVKAKLEELMADFQQAQHGIQVREVAAGYKFFSKAEHHEVLRKFVKSLKPPVRLSKPALETLAVIAYRQPVTLPEIDEIRGVDCGGVIHTLLEKKLVVTSGRKNVVGRPILYRTSRDFLVHFGLKDVGELPSLKEFEELAKQALGSEWAVEQPGPRPPEAAVASGPAPQTDAGAAESAPDGAAAGVQEAEQSPSDELPVPGDAETAAGAASFETAPRGDPDKAEERPHDEFDDAGETGAPPALPDGEEQE
jgi:segregation and condensation protein B